MAVQLQLCVANYHLRSTLTSDDSLQLTQGTGFIVLFQFEHDPFNMCVRDQRAISEGNLQLHKPPL